MKKSLISLMEGSPTKFFDDIRAKLAEKVGSVCESVASEVAPEVFEEAKTFGKDKNVADEDNAKITKGQTGGKAPDKIKKTVAEEVQPVAEDMGAHTISTTRGGKAGKSFSTLVVNKKRRTAADKDRSWKSMIMKATPKETEWDKHTKGH